VSYDLSCHALFDIATLTHRYNFFFDTNSDPMAGQGSILFVDAYDSFAENIAALLQQLLHVQVTLIKLDCDIWQRSNNSGHDFFSSFDAIVLGPGPGNPRVARDVGLFNDVWEQAAEHRIPVLGICLGFQSLCVRGSLSIERMPLPCHGHAKTIYHEGTDIFTGVGDVVATCYNSLVVRDWTSVRPSLFARFDSSASLDSTPDSGYQSRASPSSELELDLKSSGSAGDLEILAFDGDGWVMAARHKNLPFHGLQFHPESCKSNLACHQILENWWSNALAHNRSHGRTQSTLSPSVSPTSSPRRSEAVATLINKLLECTSDCLASVACKSIYLPGGPETIARLCQQVSPRNRIAMLESTKKGRYSIYSFPHNSTFHLEVYAHHTTLETSMSSAKFKLNSRDVVDAIQTQMMCKAFPSKSRILPFRGGFVGFLSYEFSLSNFDLQNTDDVASGTATPLMSLLWVDRSVVFDHQTGFAHVQSILRDDLAWIASTIKILSIAHAPPPLSLPPSHSSSMQITLPDHDTYISRIRACQAELHAGNSYELCLTTEATITTPIDPYTLYRHIQQHNPVPFAAYLSFNKTKILSSSPEQFLSWSAKDASIDMIPMKGTVKKTTDMTREKATEILASAKESAENLMIADLIRHDLQSVVGRDAEVEVVKLCDVVESETVFSLVSHIRAHIPIPPSIDTRSRECPQEIIKYGVKALTSNLPPGSMTGAPKKRSCEILQTLESRQRGIYSGAIGYMDVCGNGGWSVVIRSAFCNENESVVDEGSGERRRRWRVGAGGAITVLSDEEGEWEEMRTKLDSVLRGFGVDAVASL
jgi:para-aminobenzoate synthetase